jgi:hypothetical protein
MLIVTVDPYCVQYTPSVDVYSANVFPLRTTFTQFGRLAFVDVAVLVLPPVVGRSLKLIAVSGVPLT